MAVHVQAYFLHERLLVQALEEPRQEEFATRIERLSKLAGSDKTLAAVTAYEELVGSLLESARELGIAVVERTLAADELITLTQDFYVKRVDEERASFAVGLTSGSC